MNICSADLSWFLLQRRIYQSGVKDKEGVVHKVNMVIQAPLAPLMKPLDYEISVKDTLFRKTCTSMIGARRGKAE